MRGTRVSPTVELNASIDKHLEAAGVSQPVDVAHRISEQEYESWVEIVMLNQNELKDLMDLIGLKHKSATKLARYVEDYRRYNQQELAAERSEATDNQKQNQPIETQSNTTAAQKSKSTIDGIGMKPSSNMTDNEPDSPKTTGSLLTMENDNISLSSANRDPPSNVVNHLATIDMSSNDGIIGANELIAKATAAAQERSDFTSAVDLFREAIDLNPKSDAAWFGLGYSLYQRDGGNTEEQIR